jgi:hypothetical protein
MLPGIHLLGDESPHLLAEDVVDHHGREGRGIERKADRRLGVERILGKFWLREKACGISWLGSSRGGGTDRAQGEYLIAELRKGA